MLTAIHTHTTLPETVTAVSASPCRMKLASSGGRFGNGDVLAARSMR